MFQRTLFLLSKEPFIHLGTYKYNNKNTFRYIDTHMFISTKNWQNIKSICFY